jgi:hypothetical protein
MNCGKCEKEGLDQCCCRIESSRALKRPEPKHFDTENAIDISTGGGILSMEKE